MKILVAGATGAIGRPLVVKLIERGHEVTGMTRSESRRDLIEWLGAKSVVADALDPEAVARAVAETQPEVIVHELTAIGAGTDFRKIDNYFGLTNRLRTEGTDHLLSAAKAAGVRRFVAQSFAPLVYERSGSLIKTEEDPVDRHPLPAMRQTSEAMLYLEQAVTGAEDLEGVVLRYGGFYGDGTSIDVNPDAEQIAAIRGRKFPVVGSGGAVWSFVNVDDAAEATAIAVEKGEPGIYNIVDDNPAPVKDWLPRIADAIGAKPPRHFPKWLGRIFAGEMGVMMMTELRGSSNEKAKRELGWRPEHPSVWETLASEAAEARAEAGFDAGRRAAAGA
jgi:nucleoside-diphosphate-sugar epimerase